MEKEKKNSACRWMRILHRDIGFFVVGLTIIYCISGIMLTLRNTDFLKSETSIKKTIDSGLNANQLNRALHLKKMKVVSESEDEIIFFNGKYNKGTGLVSYTSMEIPSVLRTFNALHTVSANDSRCWFTIIYAFSLLFLAVSSFWMYRPETKNFKRGIIISALGILASLGLLLV